MNLQTTKSPIFLKIFYYEFRHLVLQKFYLGLFLVCAIYNWLILRSETILGISHTAPFSGWSFGSYLGRSIPLLVLMIYFFFYQLYYGMDRPVRVLTSAASIHPSYYLLIRCTAILAAVLLFITAIVAEGILFLYSLFSSVISIKELLAPVCFLYLPMLSLSFGFGLCTVRVHPALFFGSALLLLFLEPVAAFLIQDSSPILPESLSLSCSSYLTRYPLTLADADTPFFVPKNILAIRTLLFLFGNGCIFLGIRKNSD